MKCFSTVSDELLYQHPELWRNLVPYQVGTARAANNPFSIHPNQHRNVFGEHTPKLLPAPQGVK